VAKWWREPLDVTRHRDHFCPGGWTASEPADPLLSRSAYFVRVCGFTFEFVSIDQLSACLRFYEQRIHPSSRQPTFVPEKGHWELWTERLPMYLREEPKRVRVVKALSAALSDFASGKV
jgi:hypothetical protein